MADGLNALLPDHVIEIAEVTVSPAERMSSVKKTKTS